MQVLFFSIAQFQKGQWIEWQRQAFGSTTVVDCWRWEFVDFHSSGASLEIRKSTDCQTYDDYVVEHVLFNPNTGEVTQDVITTQGGSSQPGTLKSVLPYFYLDSQSKQLYVSGTTVIAKVKYPAFQIQGQSQFYLNLPSSPFHGSVLQWQMTDQENTNGKIWIYQIHTSNPEIQIPQN